MTRHEERIKIFTLLYEYTFYSETDPAGFLERKKASDEENYSEFVSGSFINTVMSRERIDGIISDYSVGWKTKRMSKVTISILRLAVYELTSTDVPPKAVINEAVEIAKAYDDEKAASFINGILNKAARDMGLIPNASSGKNE